MRVINPNNSVSNSQQAVLTHIVYDETKDRIVSDRPIETTLDSLYLGEQHIMSSGSDNIFYTNANTLTAWSACWSGLRNQALPLNQGMYGVYVPQGRTYSENRLPVQPWGAPNATPGNLVTFATSFVFQQNNSITGVECIVGEEVLPTDYLFFHVHYDDVDGIATYQQVLTGESIAVDGILDWDFDHPVEEYHALTYYMHVEIAATRTGTRRKLLVRAAASDMTKPGFTFFARTLLDRHISCGTTQVSEAVYRVTYASQFAVDTTTNVVAIQNPSTTTNTKTAYFRVFDAAGNFQNNACTVTVGSPSVTMTLDAKGDDFSFYVEETGTDQGDGTGFGAIWYYFNNRTGDAGLVSAINSSSFNEIPSYRRYEIGGTYTAGEWTFDQTTEKLYECNTDGVQTGPFGANLAFWDEIGHDSYEVALNTTHRTSNGSDHTFIDQDVTATSDPQFNSLDIAERLKVGGFLGSIYIGDVAGAADDGTANLNVGIGLQALQGNWTGEQNVAIGCGALVDNSIGNYNVGIGYNVLKSANSSKNTAIGHLAGFNITTGEDNVFIGAAAGSTNTTGSNNICIGASVYPSSQTASNEVILGNEGITKTLLRGTVGIGTANPNGTLDIHSDHTTLAAFQSYTDTSFIGADILCHRSKSPVKGVHALVVDGDRLGTFHYNASDGTAWKWAGYIACNVDGIASLGDVPARLDFATSSGVGNPVTRLSIKSDGKVVISNDLQVDGDYLNDVNGNIDLGTGALSALTTGSNNICIGLRAGNTIQTGTRNILIGRDADVNSGSTTNSIIIGDSYTVLVSNQAVFGNANITSTILRGAITGPVSIESGTFNATGGITTVTLNASGVITGDGDGLTNLHGGTLGNALFGTSAGNALTTGSDNTYIGKNAGLTATSGTNNICIGLGADLTSTTANNETVIGNSSTDTTLLHGYTQLGPSAPGIQIHLETGTTDNDSLTSIVLGSAIAGGIIAIGMSVQEADGHWHNSFDGTSTMKIYWDSTTIHFDNVVAAQQGRAYRLYAAYIATT